MWDIHERITIPVRALGPRVSWYRSSGTEAAVWRYQKWAPKDKEGGDGSASIYAGSAFTNRVRASPFSADAGVFGASAGVHPGCARIRGWGAVFYSRDCRHC